MKLHICLLSFPIVKGYGAKWSDTLHHHGILVSILSVDEQLEGVEKEHDAHESQSRWKKISSTKVLLSVDVEAWEQPNCKESKLKQYYVTVISLVIRNLSRSSHSPSNKWIGKNQINKESWKVPQP